MTDIVLLGAICIGLGAYCLHLRWKFDRLMLMSQVVLEGLFKGDIEIVESNGTFLPIPKKKQEQA